MRGLRSPASFSAFPNLTQCILFYVFSLCEEIEAEGDALAGGEVVGSGFGIRPVDPQACTPSVVPSLWHRPESPPQLLTLHFSTAMF